MLVVPIPKNLVLSRHHQFLSCTREIRSLQAATGLFPIHRRLLNTDCAYLNFPLRDHTRKELLKMRKCFESISEALSRKHMSLSHFRAGSATYRSQPDFCATMLFCVVILLHEWASGVFAPSRLPARRVPAGLISKLYQKIPNQFQRKQGSHVGPNGVPK